MADTATTTTATVAPDQVPYELSPQKMFSDTLIFLVLLFGIFYFILIRPQQKRINAHKLMLAAISKGSRVVTGGGIIGTVVKLEEKDIAVVEIAQGVQVKVARGSISEILSDGNASKTANDN